MLQTYAEEQLNKQAVGERIYQLRKAKKMSQMTLGELVGLSENSVSNIETGKFMAKIENLQHFARVLGTDVNYLMYGDATDTNENTDVSSEEQELEKALLLEWKKLSIIEKKKFVAGLKASNLIA
ncbi:MAG: helix-turn-helix transcriptional regulator [Lachnospiraceae bacterium]|nr:helix-turn-helix transcriptional regulator [Lachnospiraceae bacterium]